MAFDLLTNRPITKPANIDLVTKVMMKIIDDPSQGSSVYCLYGGKSFPPVSEPSFNPLATPPAAPSDIFIDAARIDAIRAHNS